MKKYYRIPFQILVVLLLAILFGGGCGQSTEEPATDTDTDSSSLSGISTATETQTLSNLETATGTEILRATLEVELNVGAVSDNGLNVTRVLVEIKQDGASYSEEVVVQDEIVKVSFPEIQEGLYQVEFTFYEYEDVVATHQLVQTVQQEIPARLELALNEIEIKDVVNTDPCTGENPTLNSNCPDVISLLEYNRSLWQSQNLTNYEFTIYKATDDCNSVMDNSISYRVIDNSSSKQSSEKAYPVFGEITIDDLFEEIISDAELMNLNISKTGLHNNELPAFDHKYGFPSEIHLSQTSSNCNTKSIKTNDFHRVVVPENFTDFSVERRLRIMEEVLIFSQQRYYAFKMLSSIYEYLTTSEVEYIELNEARFPEIRFNQIYDDANELFMSIRGDEHVYFFDENYNYCTPECFAPFSYQVTFAPDGSYLSDYDDRVTIKKIERPEKPTD